MGSYGQIQFAEYYHIKEREICRRYYLKLSADDKTVSTDTDPNKYLYRYQRQVSAQTQTDIATDAIFIAAVVRGIERWAAVILWAGVLTMLLLAVFGCTQAMKGVYNAMLGLKIPILALCSFLALKIIVKIHCLNYFVGFCFIFVFFEQFYLF